VKFVCLEMSLYSLSSNVQIRCAMVHYLGISSTEELLKEYPKYASEELLLPLCKDVKYKFKSSYARSSMYILASVVICIE
jgi:hypothetical protein